MMTKIGLLWIPYFNQLKNMHFDRRLLKLLFASKPAFAMTILFGSLGALCVIGQAQILSTIIHRVFLEKQSLASVFHFLGYFAGLSGLLFVLRWFGTNRATEVSATIMMQLRKGLSAHLTRLGPNYLKNERSGELNTTLIAGIEKIDAYFSQFLPQLFLAVLIPLTILVFIFPADVLSGFVFLLTAPLIPIFIVLIGSTAARLNDKQWQTLSRMSAHFLDVLQGLTTLKLFGRSTEQIKTISEISRDFRHATMDVLKIAFLSALVLEIVATIGIALIAVEIGLRLLHDKIAFEQAMFILIVAPEFFAPVRQLGARYHAGMEGVAAARRIFAVFDSPLPEIPNNPSLHLKNTNSILRFEHVSYTYKPDNRCALSDISLELQPGTITALVGKSGAGKTTLSHLLLQFLYPENGAIFFGDTNLQDIDAQNWRDQIAWVPQNPYLFNRTIADNIRLSNPAASDKLVREAAGQAHIHEFIEKLPEGYETQIGERGARLSGGQAQRLALARAFLKDAPILILDEPTANMDPRLERQMLDSMQHLMAGRTVLIIAHRLNTVRFADQVVVLSAGRIAEIGTHRSLLNKNGPYAELIRAAEVAA